MNKQIKGRFLKEFQTTTRLSVLFNLLTSNQCEHVVYDVSFVKTVKWDALSLGFI